MVTFLFKSLKGKFGEIPTRSRHCDEKVLLTTIYHFVNGKGW